MTKIRITKGTEVDRRGDWPDLVISGLVSGGGTSKQVFEILFDTWFSDLRVAVGCTADAFDCTADAFDYFGTTKRNTACQINILAVDEENRRITLEGNTCELDSIANGDILRIHPPRREKIESDGITIELEI